MKLVTSDPPLIREAVRITIHGIWQGKFSVRDRVYSRGSEDEEKVRCRSELAKILCRIKSIEDAHTLI